MKLVSNNLSEPYGVYTYRYFLHEWPDSCFLAVDNDTIIGVIICRITRHKNVQRGYIAMLVVSTEYRGKGIGAKLANAAVEKMKELGASEIVLETETNNLNAIKLYRKLGFVKDKLLTKYYLNGQDAFRLKIWFE